LTAPVSRRSCAKEQQQNHNDERGGKSNKNFGREAHSNMPNVMSTAELALDKWCCDLVWASNTPESGVPYGFQTGRLVIYTGIKNS
jgi:hypothetical protein